MNVDFLVNDLYVSIKQAYIDPGTGSMLFAVLIGIVSAGLYAVRGLIIKLRFAISSGKKTETSNSKIPFVIYTDSKRYWNVFEPICNQFEDRKKELVYMTQSEDDPCFNKKYQYIKCEYIGQGNKGFVKLNLLKANIVLSTTPGLDVYQWKRSKDVDYYIHILHAADDITTYRMFGLDYYDAVLLSGEFQIDEIRELERMRNLKSKEISVIGLTYFDSMSAKIKETNKVKNTNRVVLLAPSWGESSILNKFGSEAIDALINTGYEIIVRPHPQSFVSEKEIINNLINKYPNIVWNTDNDNFDVLNKADILISDFSGVMFDFALLFDKPIIYADTSFDKSPYDAWWLDKDLWKFAILPSLGKKLSKEDFKDMKNIIDDCIENKEYSKGRDVAKQQVWANEGKSAMLAADYMIEKYNQYKEINE